MRQLVYQSSLHVSLRDELEELLFFNSQQEYVRSGIIEAIETYGTPSIIVENEIIRMDIPPYQGIQSLFAIDVSDEGEHLAGAVLFVRDSPDDVIVLHIAVNEAFSGAGEFGSEMLALRLIYKVKDIASRIKGVHTLMIVYGKGRIRKIPV